MLKEEGDGVHTVPALSTTCWTTNGLTAGVRKINGADHTGELCDLVALDSDNQSDRFH